ncbi:multiple inositol polyphosphate phosphatase 1-like [Hydractinia symbiolongicarpus]|uniref:multiple inositol polyphosphate phosphatase 1-like n=1 Tax=Hydractinia symbiolongicarpus TaxID=13093 RepID=UPI0025509555|nr:multiple inositol polyphosphate phosphatase 1-like [Hydractinia symbiolongicarpus]
MKLCIFTVNFVICVLQFAVGDPFATCRKTAKFSTKTGYDMLPAVKADVTKPTDYTAVQINMVFRHGERFPGNDDVEKMKEFAKKINRFKSTISPDVNLSLPWQPKLKGIEDKMLAKQGETVLYNLGKRIRKWFPEVFAKTYSTYNYKFMSTCVLRAAGSADAIAMGIFENHGHLGPDKLQPIHLLVNPCDKDIILKAQDNCRLYNLRVKDNDTALEQVKKFEEGPEVKSVIKSIKAKFGQLGMSLSYDEVKMMYKVCSWDIIMFNGSLQNGICSMFTQDELSVIEYNEDMDDYYKRSNAYELSYKSSCPLLRDIYNSIKTKIGKPDSFSGIFRAGHSDTMLPFFALLGVYTNEIKMTSSNYITNKNRTFRGGCLAPFSSNLYFVLYKKNNGGNSTKDYKIQLYVNERLTKIPGCSSITDCTFQEFDRQYKSIVDNCDYKKMCDVSIPTPQPKSDAVYMSLTTYFSLALVTLVFAL